MGIGATNSPALVNIFDIDRRATVVLGKAPSMVLQGESFAPLLSLPNYPQREGRGVYVPVNDYPGRFFYSKGTGSAEALHRPGDSEWRQYPSIGHVDPSKYQLEPSSPSLREMQTGPRVRGALSFPHALREYIMCEVFLATLGNKLGVRDASEARERGLSTPVAVISVPGISEEINRALRGGKSRREHRSTAELSDFNYGVVVLEVPSCERIRPHVRPALLTKAEHHREVLTSPDKTEMIGRVVKYQLECGFVTQSVHFQNIYNSAMSVCPQADHSDMVVMADVIAYGGQLGIGSDEIVRSLVMSELRFAPFLLLRDPWLQRPAVQGIHSILSTIAPGVWDEVSCIQIATAFMRYPHTVLSMIAQELIDRGNVEQQAPAGWTGRVDMYEANGFAALNQVAAENMLRAALHFEAGLRRVEAKGGFTYLQP